MNSDEDCDTHDLINAQPKPIAEAIVRIIEEAGSFDADFDILLEAARLIVGRDDEITRLLAVEVAAKILAGPSNVRYCPESQGMADYQCLTCHSSWVKKATQYTLLPAPY